MYLFAGFESRISLEMLTHELEEHGVKEKEIIVISMKHNNSKHKLFDTIHYSDGISLFDGSAALATVGMLFGVIFGSLHLWGPIIFGLLGLAIGAILGYLLDKKIGKLNKSNNKSNIDILLLIPYHSKEEKERLTSLCTKYFVLTIGEYEEMST